MSLTLFDKKDVKEKSKGYNDSKKRKNNEKVKRKEAQKQVKKRKKLQKKYKKESIREKNNAFAPLFGYDYRPSYLWSGNRCGTILKIVNKYGTNHDGSFGSFV